MASETLENLVWFVFLADGWTLCRVHLYASVIKSLKTCILIEMHFLVCYLGVLNVHPVTAEFV